jgi:uncharacterized membrane protein YedE/YeeE
MMEYWPWWIGALALGCTSVIYLLVMGRLLGVSGSWAKVVYWKENRRNEIASQQLINNQSEVNDVLMAETLAEFGEEAVAELQAAPGEQPITTSDLKAESPWAGHLTFLLSMLLGSLLVTYFTGQIEFRLDLSDIHTSIFGELWEVWLALLFGGLMVGFGTQMAGGCTSGHGLSGCSRLIPSSLIATISFMLAAIVLSMLMEVMIP